MLLVVPDACQIDGRGISAVMVIESDKPEHVDAINELSHMSTRDFACKEAARLFNLADARVNGLTLAPYAVDAAGVSYQEASEKGNTGRFHPSRYRVDVPVVRKVI